MVTIWNLPRIEIQSLRKIDEKRPVALITGRTAWNTAGELFKLPLVAQAEPRTAEREKMNELAENLPSQAQVIYAVGGDDGRKKAVHTEHRRDDDHRQVTLPADVFGNIGHQTATHRINHLRL